MSLNRRQVVHGAALATAASLFTVERALAAAPAPLLHIYDRRFAVARDSAIAANRNAVATRAIDGDVTPVWRTPLSALVRNNRFGIVSGVTTAPALRCLEIMVRSEGWALLDVSVVQGTEQLRAWTLGRLARGLAR